jgi:hypothetical protein
MSKPQINSYDKGNMPPPSFEEAMQSEASKQGAAYPKQEGWISAAKPAGDGFPVAPALLVSEQSFIMTLTFSVQSAPFGTLMSMVVMAKVHQFVQSGI